MESARRVPWVVFGGVTAVVVAAGLCAWAVRWVPMDHAVRAVVRPARESETIEVAVAGRRLTVPVRVAFDRVQSVQMAGVLRQARKDAGGVSDTGRLIQLQALMRALLGVGSESARILVAELCRPEMPANTYAARCRWAQVRDELTARASLVPTQTDEVMAIAAALFLMESGAEGRAWMERLADVRPDLASMIEEQR